MTAPRVLAIHAHPDDIEFQAAGTLALLRKLGCEVVMATMTPGNLGSAEHVEEEIAEIRREEGRKSAEMLQAQYVCLEFRDLSIDNDSASRRRVTEAVRKANPKIVLTAPPVDYMTDHEVTSSLVRDACFCASVPLYKTGEWDPAEPIESIPYLYYMDPIEGVDWFGKPSPYDFIVDVSETIDTKLEMLACHTSQRNWLRKQHGVDEYLENCRRWSGRRGEEIETAYGEAFRQHKGHPYPHDNLLLSVLKGNGNGV